MAHRIPLYIPPFILSEENDPAYEALEVRKLETNDSDEYDQLCAEQAKLEVFEPVMKHAIDDNQPPVLFHSRMVHDFLMVEEIAEKVLRELKPLQETD